MQSGPDRFREIATTSANNAAAANPTIITPLRIAKRQKLSHETSITTVVDDEQTNVPNASSASTLSSNIKCQTSVTTILSSNINII